MTHAWQTSPVWCAARFRSPRSAESGVPPEPPRRRRGIVGVGGRASRGMRDDGSPSVELLAPGASISRMGGSETK